MIDDKWRTENIQSMTQMRSIEPTAVELAPHGMRTMWSIKSEVERMPMLMNELVLLDIFTNDVIKSATFARIQIGAAAVRYPSDIFETRF